MRLTTAQINTIRQEVQRSLGQSAVIWLFGSRLDDQKKGGDVDLYVETTKHRLFDELSCKITLEEQLEMPVDLIVRQPLDSAIIARIAKTQGVRI